MHDLIYLDNHATTPLDPDVLKAMLPLLTEHFANPGSVTHEAGRMVNETVQHSFACIAQCLGAEVDEIVATSGATESNNLAIFGSCLHPRQKRRKVVSLVSEHKAVLDPLKRLEQHGFEVVYLPVARFDADVPGLVDFDALESAIDDSVALVTVMMANNEIGTIEPLRKIANKCHQFDCLLHTDATQAVGRLPVNVDELDVDLMSFSAHKFYGPKGVGGLFVRRRKRLVKLQSQIVGGGQQHNLRSGTLNSVGIVGMAVALEKSYRENGWLTDTLTDPPEYHRLASLRDRLFELLRNGVADFQLNGPTLECKQGCYQRLPGNLNGSFYPIEGQSLMLELPDIAMSSGSACTSADPRPSHVLAAIGLTEEVSRSSLRFGIGRFNTEEQIDKAGEAIIQAAKKLRKLL